MATTHAGARTSLLVPVALMACGNLIFAFNDVWLRWIADDVGIVQSVWGRSVILLVLMTLVLRRSDWTQVLQTPKPHLQIARSCCPVVGSFMMLAAMARIPVADATATFFLSPIIAVLLAMLLLRERIGVEKWVALVLGFAGMLVIVRPGSGTFQLGHVLALATAFTVAFYQILTTLVTRSSNAKVTLFFMAATATLVTSCIVPFTWTPTTRVQWLHLGATTLVYAVGHAMYIMAHARAEASRLSPLVYFQLIGTIAGGLLFYGQVPQIYTILGGALIALGGCIALMRRPNSRAAPKPRMR